MPDDKYSTASQTANHHNDFFIYIVESPSASDLYDGISEGGLVAQFIRLDSIQCVTRTAINSTAFVTALTIGLAEAMIRFPDRYPILHLSAHGGKEGIQLSSGEVLTWAKLKDLLIPINESFRGELLLCMSSCEGYSACRNSRDTILNSVGAMNR